jgi:hypothetical protein
VGGAAKGQHEAPTAATGQRDGRGVLGEIGVVQLAETIDGSLLRGGV